MKNAISMLVLIGATMATAQTEIPLWDGNMPGNGAGAPEGSRLDEDTHVIVLENVSEPMLTFYPAADAGKPNPVVVVCPGGSYNILAYDLEGTEIAEWLNSIGVSAAVLKYRVPDNRAGALLDARRAVRLVRENSKAWNIDPRRVGMLGFSAGGHLAASCSNSPDRPDFTVLVYPAYLYRKGGIELVEEIKIDAKTPPAFIVQTWDDRAYYRSSLAYAAALDARNIPVELHLFAKGGHGYGLRPSERPVSQWPSLCRAWMEESGFLK